MTASSQRRAAVPDDSGVRERLVEAAGEVITAGGVAAATSRAITDRAGENLASITYYFGSKDALVSEALVREARTLLQPVLDALGSADPPATRLLIAVQMLTRIVRERGDQLAGYLDGLSRSARDEQVATEIRSLWRGLQRRLADDMASQRETGLIPAWVDPEAMAALIVALGNGVAAGVAVDPEATDPAAIGEQFTSLLLAARTAAEPGG
jgi:AcrR family transcriptional regulator